MLEGDVIVSMWASGQGDSKLWELKPNTKKSVEDQHGDDWSSSQSFNDESENKTNLENLTS